MSKSTKKLKGTWMSKFCFGHKDKSHEEYARKHLFIFGPKDGAFKLTRKTQPKEK